jgi:hypothetical protein
VHLPHSDHTNKPVKIWLHLPASTKLPSMFLDTIRQKINLGAKTIVESETCQLKRSILLSNINMDSSSLSDMNQPSLISPCKLQEFEKVILDQTSVACMLFSDSWMPRYGLLTTQNCFRVPFIMNKKEDSLLLH